MDPAIILQGQGLTMRFGGLIAMAEVDFSLRKGEVLGIIGPNGAGKSTLLNIITGLYVPSSGEVRLSGELLNGQPAHRIVAKGIARTFQSSRLFADLSVLDNVIIGRHTHMKTGVFDAIFNRRKADAELDAAAEIAERLLKAVSRELHAQRHRPAGELPQADRRRLEIARALASEPKVLLLDEPSSGMDDADTDALMDDIRSVCAERLLKAVSRELHAQRHRPAGELPQADRRRLEIARALASEPKVLLLDEPSSGMDDADTDALMDDIRSVCAERPDLALMIIEHDMRLIASLPQRVLVLDYGQKLAEGTFEEVRLIPRVQEAYLGRKGAQHAQA